MQTLLCLNFFVVTVLIGFQSFAQKADLIFTNGKIFTSDTTQLYAQALAIKDNKILAVGNNQVIEKFAATKTRKIDLQGKTVIPGINDAHDHAAFEISPAPLSYQYREVNVAGPTKAEVLDSLSSLAAKARPGQWITGMVGTNIFFDTSMRHSLDSLLPNNPVSLQNWWGHGIVTNLKGLQAAGLSDNDKVPVGGWYQRDRQGKIAAVQENAQVPFWIAINQDNPKTVITLMQAFAQDQVRGGITSTQFLGTGFTHTLATSILQQARLPQRIRLIAWPRSTPEGRQVSEWPLAVYPTPTSTISGIKYMIDGTPFEGNALRSQPYTNRGNGTGRLNYSMDTMRQILREALNTRRQLWMHITADSSFSIVMKLMAELGTPAQWKPLRVRVEHNTVDPIKPAERIFLREAGILMMHTPKYGQGSPVSSLLKDGVIVGISPDGTINPFFDLYMVTSQQSNPVENLTIEQAVIAFTKTNAYAEFKENEKGMLKKGMLADLAVLSEDIFTIPANQLPATRSILTLIDGKIVYQE